MKLVFTKSNLNKAVSIVMKAVPTRTTMNILECILIDATTNEIKFTGNDMELGIETIGEDEIVSKEISRGDKKKTINVESQMPPVFLQVGLIFQKNQTNVKDVIYLL